MGPDIRYCKRLLLKIHYVFSWSWAQNTTFTLQQCPRGGAISRWQVACNLLGQYFTSDLPFPCIRCVELYPHVGYTNNCNQSVTGKHIWLLTTYIQVWYTMWTVISLFSHLHTFLVLWNLVFRLLTKRSSWLTAGIQMSVWTHRSPISEPWTRWIFKRLQANLPLEKGKETDPCVMRLEKQCPTRIGDQLFSQSTKEIARETTNCLTKIRQFNNRTA